MFVFIYTYITINIKINREKLRKNKIISSAFQKLQRVLWFAQRANWCQQNWSLQRRTQLQYINKEQQVENSLKELKAFFREPKSQIQKYTKNARWSFFPNSNDNHGGISWKLLQLAFSLLQFWQRRQTSHSDSRVLANREQATSRWSINILFSITEGQTNEISRRHNYCRTVFSKRRIKTAILSSEKATLRN